MPFLAPDVTDLRRLAGGSGLLRFFAIQAMLHRGARKGDKALHGPVLRHLNAAVDAPYRPRRRPLSSGLRFMSVFAHTARIAQNASLLAAQQHPFLSFYPILKHRIASRKKQLSRSVEICSGRDLSCFC
jgi:hypothetical protein